METNYGGSISRGDIQQLHYLRTVLPLNYKRTTSQVFSDATCYIINLHQSLDVMYLAAAYHDVKDLPLLEPRLPSWTPDWRSLPPATYLDSVWKWFFVMTVYFEQVNGSAIKAVEHKRNLGPAHFLDHFEFARSDFGGYAQPQMPLSTGHLFCKGTLLASVPAKWRSRPKLKLGYYREFLWRIA